MRPPYRNLVSAVIIHLVFAVNSVVNAQPGSRLDSIRDKGYLTCGVLPKVAGFATVDGGNYSGFEVDFCRAISAAILGDPDSVRYVIVRTMDQFKSRNDIDVASRRLTWTVEREAANDLLFSPVIFYDGAGFLVPATSDLQHPRQLAEQPICVKTGSEANRALSDYFAAKNLRLVEVSKDTMAAASTSFFTNECAALVADISELAAERAAQGRNSDNFEILPQTISREPLALLMRQNEEKFFLTVRWTIFLLIGAEELGVSSTNVDAKLRSSNPSMQWIAGINNSTGMALGLDKEWALIVIKKVGNYGEIYERNLGAESPIRLERGLNNLRSAGGMIYAPPFR